MQRALFARLLLQDAQVILLDEPFTAIDAKTTADLLDLVRRWHDESRTVVAVLHDLDVVKRVFPETLLIAREPVAWGDTGEVLSAANLLKARRMIEAHDPHAELPAIASAGVTSSRLASPEALMPCSTSSSRPFSEFEFMRRALVGVIAHRDRRRPDRRLSHAAAHEPDGRCHGPCDPARRGRGLPGRRACRCPP